MKGLFSRRQFFPAPSVPKPILRLKAHSSQISQPHGEAIVGSIAKSV
jgi:hypothetical protein